MNPDILMLFDKIPAAWPLYKAAEAKTEVYFMLTFGLLYRLEHPRIAEAVEPYPNRWIHHAIITSPEDLGERVMAWLWGSYGFSMIKGRKRI